MRHRIEQLIQQPLYGMWCGTFHSLCHRMLRQNFQAADLQENFQILDQDDQQKLLKKIQKSAQLDEAKWPVKKTQTIINSLKEQGKRAKDTDNNESSYQQTITMIYQHKNNVKVFIDPKATMYLLGSEMDYSSDKLSSRFIFKNPNEKSTCGCGESFAV